MKKKDVISVIAVLFIAILGSVIAVSAANFQNMKPSDYNIGISYGDELKSDKPAIVLFYANWCTYCKRFMPSYKLLSEVYGRDYNFVMVDIDDSQYTDIIKDYALSGFPTIYIIDPAIDNRILLNNALYSNLFALRGEIERYLRIRKMINIPKKQEK